MSNMKHIVGFAVISAAFNASTSWAQMDHGEMQMQGGSAPDNARDPHAYSDGYTLTDGPYAQQGPRQLKLADEHAFLSVLGDRLEYSEDSGDTTFDLLARYGTTYDSLVVKAEGDTKGSQLEESQTDLLWSHAISVFFDTQLGVRLDPVSYTHLTLPTICSV